MIKMFKKILLGVDSSENSMKAIDKVIELIGQLEKLDDATKIIRLLG